MRKKMERGWKKALLCAGAVLLLGGCGKAKEAYDKGMELAKDGKYEKSLPYFEEAIKESSEQAEYYIGYGMALNYSGRYEDAKAEFDKVIQDKDNKISKENNKQVYYGLAIAEYNLGEYDNVIECCENALSIEYLEDMDCDILYTRMSSFCQKEEWADARKDCQEIIKKNKRYYDAYFSLAEIEQRLGNQDEAVNAYLTLIEEDKSYYDAYFGLYGQYLASGREEAANELLEQLTMLDTKEAENMMVIGRAYLCRKEYDKAEENLNLAYSGNCKESKYYLGLLYMEEKEYEKALEAFQTYVEENKEDFHVEAYCQLASIYIEQAEYEKARGMIEKGMTYGSGSAVQDLKKTEVILCERQNNYQEALSLAKEYRKLYPADSGMKKEISFIKTRLKK